MSADKTISLLIVIVNYRTAGLTIECLQTLAEEVAQAGDISIQVIVADNASGDDSVPQLENAIQSHGWSHWAGVLPLATNSGFAGGNNAAIRAAMQQDQNASSQGPGRLPEYVMLLNPDTLVRPGAIRTLVNFMQANPKAGIAGSRLEHPDSSPQNSAFRFPNFWGEVDAGLAWGLITMVLHRHVTAPPVRLETYATDWVSGACFVIRRRCWNRWACWTKATSCITKK
ncbi:MAG: glycosyltransferase [Phycisphaerales bacterium]|nr:glycosyltransferase [Phycisphaerales bacterium]